MLNALEDEETLLLWAALHRQDLKAVQKMILDGTDVNMPDRNGMTPLLIVCYLDNTDLVRELLQADACVNAANNSGQTALHMAARNGNTEIVNLLLKYECRVNAMSKYSGMTPLHEASHRGHNEVVQLLLDHGANINVLDMVNKNPEYYAASAEVTEVFKKYRNDCQINGSNQITTADKELINLEESDDLKEILEKYQAEINEKKDKVSESDDIKNRSVSEVQKTVYNDKTPDKRSKSDIVKTNILHEENAYKRPSNCEQEKIEETLYPKSEMETVQMIKPKLVNIKDDKNTNKMAGSTPKSDLKLTCTENPNKNFGGPHKSDTVKAIHEANTIITGKSEISKAVKISQEENTDKSETKDCGQEKIKATVNPESEMETVQIIRPKLVKDTGQLITSELPKSGSKIINTEHESKLQKNETEVPKSVIIDSNRPPISADKNKQESSFKYSRRFRSSFGSPEKKTEMRHSLSKPVHVLDPNTKLTKKKELQGISRRKSLHTEMKEKTEKVFPPFNTRRSSVDSDSLSSDSGSHISNPRELTPKKPQKQKVVLQDHTMEFSDKHRERMKVNVFDRLSKK